MNIESNNHSLRLISFTSTKVLVISSTHFQFSNVKIFVSKLGKTKGRINIHLLIDKIYKSSVRQARSFRGANEDTDIIT